MSIELYCSSCRCPIPINYPGRGKPDVGTRMNTEFPRQLVGPTCSLSLGFPNARREDAKHTKEKERGKDKRVVERFSHFYQIMHSTLSWSAHMYDKKALREHLYLHRGRVVLQLWLYLTMMNSNRLLNRPWSFPLPPPPNQQPFDLTMCGSKVID